MVVVTSMPALLSGSAREFKRASSLAWLLGVRKGQAAPTGGRFVFPAGRGVTFGSTTCRSTILAEIAWASSAARLARWLEALLKSTATRSVFVAMSCGEKAKGVAKLFLIDFGFLECFCLGNGHCPGLSIKFLEEAAVVSGVTRASDLLDLEQEHVAVAICKPAFDLLGMAAGFPLEPKLFS